MEKNVAVSPEQFAQGLTYDAYKAQMTRNQERFAANEQQVVLDPAAVAAARGLRQPLNVLVLAEDWCGDVIDNLPILGSLAAAAGGKLDVRVFLRDQRLDLMDQYLKGGEFRSIPVFVFFDQGFNELGRLIERPDSVTERRAQRRQQLYAQHPEFGSPDAPVDQLPEEARVALAQALADMRAELKQQDNKDVQDALRAIVQRADDGAV